MTVDLGLDLHLGLGLGLGLALHLVLIELVAFEVTKSAQMHLLLAPC